MVVAVEILVNMSDQPEEQPSETMSTLDLSSSPNDFSASEQQPTQESEEEKILSAMPPPVSVSFTGATVEDLDTPALACIEEVFRQSLYVTFTILINHKAAS